LNKGGTESPWISNIDIVEEIAGNFSSIISTRLFLILSFPLLSKYLGFLS
jgi:hypothetical protein